MFLDRKRRLDSGNLHQGKRRFRDMPIEKVGDIRLEDPRIWVGLSATIK